MPLVSKAGGGGGEGAELRAGKYKANIKLLVVNGVSASVSLRTCFVQVSFFDQLKLRTTQGRGFWETEFQLRYTDTVTSNSQHTTRRTCKAKEQETGSSESRQEWGPEVSP